MIETVGNILGIGGMALFLLAYFFLQKGTWQPHSYAYLGMNLAGSLLLIASLLIDWNLSAFLLEVAWGLISLWGIARLLKRW